MQEEAQPGPEESGIPAITTAVWMLEVAFANNVSVLKGIVGDHGNLSLNESIVVETVDGYTGTIDSVNITIHSVNKGEHLWYEIAVELDLQGAVGSITTNFAVNGMQIVTDGGLDVNLIADVIRRVAIEVEDRGGNRVATRPLTYQETFVMTRANREMQTRPQNGRETFAQLAGLVFFTRLAGLIGETITLDFGIENPIAFIPEREGRHPLHVDAVTLSTTGRLGINIDAWYTTFDEDGEHAGSIRRTDLHIESLATAESQLANIDLVDILEATIEQVILTGIMEAIRRAPDGEGPADMDQRILDFLRHPLVQPYLETIKFLNTMAAVRYREEE